MSRRHNLILLGATVVIGLALAEAGLRLAGVSYPEFHRLDETVGWSPRPGMKGLWTVEGRAYLSINAEGFRDDPHPLAKAEGVFRIAVLGDSFTEARAVPKEKTFWSVMGERLAACPAFAGRKIEVMNFGVSGYGTAQELITLRRHALKYRPDLVLLAVFTGNDIWNNSRALDGHPDRPYLVFRDGEPVLDMSFRDSARFRSKLAWQGFKHGLINHSRILQLAKEAYIRAKRLFSTKSARAAAALDRPGPMDAVYKPPETEPWRAAWRATEAALSMMAREVRARGAAFWIATLANPIQDYPDAALRARFEKRLGIESLDYPDKRIAALARRLGAGAITLAPTMRAYAERTGVFLHGYANTAPGIGHWNAAGHALAGRLIADALCAAQAAGSGTDG